MNRVIRLHPAAAKCLPSKPCPQQEGCARRQVAYTMGRPVKDMSTEPAYAPGKCGYWMSVEKARAAAPADGPRVREPVRGLA